MELHQGRVRLWVRKGLFNRRWLGTVTGSPGQWPQLQACGHSGSLWKTFNLKAVSQLFPGLDCLLSVSQFSHVCLYTTLYLIQGVRLQSLNPCEMKGKKKTKRHSKAVRLAPIQYSSLLFCDSKKF